MRWSLFQQQKVICSAIGRSRAVGCKIWGSRDKCFQPRMEERNIQFRHFWTGERTIKEEMLLLWIGTNPGEYLQSKIPHVLSMCVMRAHLRLEKSLTILGQGKL